MLLGVIAKLIIETLPYSQNSGVTPDTKTKGLGYKRENIMMQKIETPLMFLVDLY